jgi:pimeloyl-ACP methyl ester carboxylesterase
MLAAMPTAIIDDIEICYESYGPDEAAPLLLDMGFTAQMTLWPTGFIAELLERGFRVIRFDNRDCGLSSKTAGDPPDGAALLMAAMTGKPVDAPYTLSDMAGDAVGLLDHLGIDAAHVVGASMGGMIVQHMAIDFPERVRSMTSIMSTTGNPAVGAAEPDAMGALLAPPPGTRDEVVAASAEVGRIISGPLFDPVEAVERAREAYDRCFHPIGAAFQLAAIAASGDRTDALRQLDVPTLVIHGRVDPLITLSGGMATAEAIAGADLLVLGDMGHDLPKPYWAQMADAIIGVARQAEDDHSHDGHDHDH